QSRVFAGETIGRYSDRTISAAISVDRESASLIAFTLKPSPFERTQALADARPLAGAEVPEGAQGLVQIEIALLGPGNERYTQRVDVQGLCFDHPADAEPHIAGDTIRLHRES